jgi:hypothetical protein
MDTHKHEALGSRIPRIDTKGFAHTTRFGVRRSSPGRIRRSELDAAFQFYASTAKRFNEGKP